MSSFVQHISDVNVTLIIASSPLCCHRQVVSVTFMKGGHAHNVIPESVSFGGTFRSLTAEGFSYLMKRIKEVSNEGRTLFLHFSINL